jgi:hypothetical protein
MLYVGVLAHKIMFLVDEFYNCSTYLKRDTTWTADNKTIMSFVTVTVLRIAGRLLGTQLLRTQLLMRTRKPT